MMNGGNYDDDDPTCCCGASALPDAYELGILDGYEYTAYNNMLCISLYYYTMKINLYPLILTILYSFSEILHIMVRFFFGISPKTSFCDGGTNHI